MKSCSSFILFFLTYQIQVSRQSDTKLVGISAAGCNTPMEFKKNTWEYQKEPWKFQGCLKEFIYEGYTYQGCANPDLDPVGPWCSTMTDKNGVHVTGNFLYCLCTCVPPPGCQRLFRLDYDASGRTKMLATGCSSETMPGRKVSCPLEGTGEVVPCNCSVSKENCYRSVWGSLTVCASNGVTYPNRCFLRRAQAVDPNITVVHDRQCTQELKKKMERPKEELSNCEASKTDLPVDCVRTSWREEKDGELHHGCKKSDHERPWCPTKIDRNKVYDRSGPIRYCNCKSTWTYKNVTYVGCARPDGPRERPWCATAYELEYFHQGTTMREGDWMYCDCK